MNELYKALEENDRNLAMERRVHRVCELLHARTEILRSIIHAQGDIIAELTHEEEEAA